jgi:menaquinone-specific isochorismate synthase
MTQIKVSMPVVDSPQKLILKDKIVDDFWHYKTSNYTVTDKTKIISLALKIPTIDPLAFLQKIGDYQSIHFYWENPSKQEAVLAFGATKYQSFDSQARFIKAQKFVKGCWKQLIRKGETNSIIGQPSIFCSFTFFSDSNVESAFFPGATVFLPRFQIVRKHKACLLIVNTPLDETEGSQKTIERLKQEIARIDWAQLVRVERSLKVNTAADVSTDLKDARHFKSAVGEALNSIAVNEFSKIVIAYATDIKSTTPFQVIESLSNLRDRHPDCYIFSTSNGRGQQFIGASPERLVSIQNQQLVTDALAGSAPRGKTNAEDTYLANLLLKSRKEKREHQAVSDFIFQRLQQLDLKPHQLPLQLLRLSNIQHLWTPIYAHLPKNIEPLTIVEQLHPTPAVAGLPTKLTCEKIRYYEKFDRSLYASPLGWVDSSGNCEFVVGIRSALIDGDRAQVYAGAGIVSGSNPDKEFAEIQLKLQSLLKALV